MSGAARFTFNNPFLQDGIDFVVVAIGVFALTEVIVTAREVRSGKRAEVVKAGRVWIQWKEFVYSLPSIARGTGFGFLVGMLPGAGATLSTFIAYNLEKRLCKNPELLGTGDHPRRLPARRRPTNAASGASLIPLLTLGLPGGGATAVMLRRLDDARHHAGADDVREARLDGVGADRQHVCRQRPAADPELAAGSTSSPAS